ncbi:MAG: hypothetical protein J0H74_15355 [Chitinophagaceae bacterium]|nr:hypothetical protein [Chitinophagaceae bacterium]
MKKTFFPLALTGAWLLIVFVYDIIAIPYLLHHTSGGAQRPATFLMSSIKVAIWGVFILSILTSVLFFRQLKKTWYINGSLFIISGMLIMGDYIDRPDISYGYNVTTDSVGGYEIKVKTEYYDMTTNAVRSKSYWKNGQKDSVWTTYHKNGEILQQQRYVSGKLIK